MPRRNEKKRKRTTTIEAREDGSRTRPHSMARARRGSCDTSSSTRKDRVDGGKDWHDSDRGGRIDHPVPDRQGREPLGPGTAQDPEDVVLRPGQGLRIEDRDPRPLNDGGGPGDGEEGFLRRGAEGSALADLPLEGVAASHAPKLAPGAGAVNRRLLPPPDRPRIPAT